MREEFLVKFGWPRRAARSTFSAIRGIVLGETVNPELMIVVKQSGDMLSLTGSGMSIDELIEFANKRAI